MTKTAVLLDTASIQKYVFGSNKLRENLGASYIVKNLYKNILDYCKTAQIIYEGGGNVLVCFDDSKEAKEFLRNWSTDNLIKFPGLSIASAISENFELQDGSFKESLNSLFNELARNKNKYFPLTRIKSYGITAECPRTGFSAEVYDDGEYISSVAAAKIKYAAMSDSELKDNYAEILNTDKCFSSDFDELGGSENDTDYIAVVHIDGNGMGDRFKACRTASEIKALSQTVETAVEESFREIISERVLNDAILSDVKITKRGNKSVLPIRPVIIGGDDITFVCDARLGIYFAQKYLEVFAKKQASDNIPLSACAGVSIVKKKYPFYRAYENAEDLCQTAKMKRKVKNDNGSWIDFNIAYGGITGSVEEIRDKHFKSTDNSILTLRPYRIEDTKLGIEDIINASKVFSDKKNWPNSKIKLLRDVLFGSKLDRSNFIQELKFRGRKLPVFPKAQSKFEDAIVVDQVTPYLDVIELMEFYPASLLKKEHKDE